MDLPPIERQLDVKIKSASTLHTKRRAELRRKFLVYDGSGDGASGRRWSDGVEAIDFRRFGEALADAWTS